MRYTAFAIVLTLAACAKAPVPPATPAVAVPPPPTEAAPVNDLGPAQPGRHECPAPECTWVDDTCWGGKLEKVADDGTVLESEEIICPDPCCGPRPPVEE
jgi:hypothetical protein